VSSTSRGTLTSTDDFARPLKNQTSSNRLCRNRPRSWSYRIATGKSTDLYQYFLPTNALVPQVPISGGGSAFAWNSSTVIALLVVGGAMLVGFLCAQWKLSRLPILPRELAVRRYLFHH
jgi:hypothetical protein